jgi:hypothetical protein
MAWKPVYVEPDDLAEYVRIDDDVDDAWLALAVSAASRAMDRHCLRQFGALDAPQLRRYAIRWDRRRGAHVAVIDDLMTTTGLLVAGAPVTSPDLSPLNAAEDGLPWDTLVIPDDVVSALETSFVDVTARWGWTTGIPTAIEQATALQAGRVLSRRGALFGVAGSPESGSEVRLLARLDPDVAVLVPVYRRRTRPR